MINTQGHSAAYDGLRGHSIGKHYPLGVTYIGSPFDGSGRWCIVNVPRMKVYTTMEGWPYSFHLIDSAYGAIEYLAGSRSFYPEIFDDIRLLSVGNAIRHWKW